MPSSFRRCGELMLLAAITTPIAAQSLSGRVVDPVGNGIAGVHIVFSNGGPTATTGATGNSTATGLQNRTYTTVAFRSPTSQWAPRELVNVQVNGSTSIGNQVLQPGAAVTGLALTPAGTGAVGG